MDKKIELDAVIYETIEGTGNAFASGVTAGCFIYFASGCYLSPRGKRLMGGIKNVRDRATLFGGSIAMWSAMFNVSRGLCSYYRQADDKYSASFGGFMSGVLSNIRGSLWLGINQGAQFAFMFYFIFGLSEKGEKLARKSRAKEIEEKGKIQVEYMQTQMPRYYLQVVEQNRHYRNLHLKEIEDE